MQELSYQEFMTYQIRLIFGVILSIPGGLWSSPVNGHPFADPTSSIKEEYQVIVHSDTLMTDFWCYIKKSTHLIDLEADL